jgi:hypothetical protein
MGLFPFVFVEARQSAEINRPIRVNIGCNLREGIREFFMNPRNLWRSEGW